MNEVVTFSNILSILRAPLALCLFSNDPTIRFLAIFIAMCTDFFDGYFARRWHQVSKTGIILDPLMDKMFVFLALFVLFFEKALLPWELLTFFTRDIALLLFGCLMLAKKSISQIKLRSTLCSKTVTAFQFLILLCLALDVHVAPFLYIGMAVIGAFAFIELLFIHKKELSRDIL